MHTPPPPPSLPPPPLPDSYWRLATPKVGPIVDLIKDELAKDKSVVITAGGRRYRLDLEAKRQINMETHGQRPRRCERRRAARAPRDRIHPE